MTYIFQGHKTAWINLTYNYTGEWVQLSQIGRELTGPYVSRLHVACEVTISSADIQGSNWNKSYHGYLIRLHLDGIRSNLKWYLLTKAIGETNTFGMIKPVWMQYVITAK